MSPSSSGPMTVVSQVRAAAQPASLPRQLVLFDESTRSGKVTKAGGRVQVGPGRVTQLTELPGETFEDIFA